MPFASFSVFFPGSLLSHILNFFYLSRYSLLNLTDFVLDFVTFEVFVAICCAFVRGFSNRKRKTSGGDYSIRCKKESLMTCPKNIQFLTYGVIQKEWVIFTFRLLIFCLTDGQISTLVEIRGVIVVKIIQ